tara:strand:+ start:101 stop:829 length:729 start_codon:yes stop_codon:yes gene_type:complete
MVLTEFIIYLLIGCSVIAGYYYLNLNPADKITGFFVYYLLFDFFASTVGMYARIIRNNEGLHFLKDTFLYNDYWFFNPVIVIGFALYAFYFRLNLKNNLLRQLLAIGIFSFVSFSVIDFLYSDIFFTSHSKSIFLLGSLLTITGIFFFYYELLKSNKILKASKNVTLYVSVAYLIHNLINLPIWIYTPKYFTAVNPDFIRLYYIVLSTSYLILYGTYIFAFIYCDKLEGNSKNLGDGKFVEK